MNGLEVSQAFAFNFEEANMATPQQNNLTDVLQRDSYFGPVANNAGGQRWDFTLLFEQSILAIGPSTLLLIVLPLRLLQLARQRQKVSHSFLIFIKCGAYIVFGALHITMLAQWAAAPSSSTLKQVSIAASTLGTLDAISLGALSYMEHNRSVKPSTVISTYLIFSTIFDAVQCRTLWLLGTDLGLAAVFSTMLATKIIIFALEVLGKQGILLETWSSLGPESTSGIVSKAFFWWLNDLIIRGFSVTLSLSSLWKTDQALQSSSLLFRIQHSRIHNKSTSKHALFWSVLHSLRWPLATCVFPRLCVIAFKFAQPFLIKRVILYVGTQRSSGSNSDGYGLIGASGLIYIGIALSTGFYQHKVFRSMTMIRGQLVSLILNGTVELEACSTSGSGALTLVTSDVDRICSAFESFHEIWANVVELGLAIWLLELQLGIGCLGPVATVIICFVATGQIARLTGPATKNWNAAIQNRVSITSEIIGSARETKILGLVASWIDAIQLLRVTELKFSQRSRTLMMCMNVLGNTPSKIAPVVTFGIAVFSPKLGLDGRLSTSTAFASLTIMGLIVGPLSMLMYAIPDFVSSFGCFERIEAFLSEVDGTTLDEMQRDSSDEDSVIAMNEGLELSTTVTEKLDKNVITAHGANFFIKAGDDPILKDINIQIEPGSHTVVLGKVGSGKTTLLRSLLGELHTEGYLKTPRGRVAYCAQTTWLVNLTIRQNILGQSELDEPWYKTVISACALDTDFEQLPDGDLTKVGSKGMTLSGGQKQRIGLARAVYSRLSLVIADDILSGLDWTTRKHIWNQVFGSYGILQKLGITIILATHSLSYIDDDYSVIVLGEHGKIKYQGNFGSFSGQNNLLTLLPGQGEEADPRANDIEEYVQRPQADKKGKSRASHNETKTAAFNGLGDSSLYAYYLKSIGWKYGIPLFGVLVAHALMGVLSDIWLRIWTDANRNDDGIDTKKYYGIYALIALLTLATIGLDTWFMFVQVIPRSGQNLHLKLLRTVMRAPLSFFATTDSGDLINRFSKDMTLVDRDLPSNFWQCVGALFSTLATAGLVLQGASYFGAIVPLAVLFLFGLQKVYLRTSRQLRLLDLQSSAPLYTHLLETLDGLVTIRAFGWQSATRKEALRLLDDAQRPHYLLFCIQRWLTLILDLFVAACGIILVALSVTLPTATSAGSIALALVNLIGLSQLLTHVITTWTTLETSLGAISRLKSFEANTPQEPSIERNEDLPATWPSFGRIQIQQVTASYSTAAGATPVLNNISLEIEPGHKVAICGRTGSGKSSLLFTLLRLLELDSGCISIDGFDIGKIPLDTLRQSLISVPQGAAVFPGSLRSNLTATISARSLLLPSDDQLISTLDKVELWDKLSIRGDLDTDIADFAMSNGQRQLLCLARAIIGKDFSPILILDEAMSDVDEHTEEVMTKIIETDFVHHTVLAVVHKLHSVRKFDNIVLLDHGHVLETGTWTELLSMENGKFRDLFENPGR